LCQRLKQDPLTSKIPAIMLTARGYHLEPHDTEQSGILRMISKPFSRGNCWRRSMKYWNLQRQREGLGGNLGEAMATAVATKPVEKQADTPIAAAALDNLAARFRPGGLFIVMLRPDGTLAYHDSAAGVFFHRYVLPMLQYRDASNDELRNKVQALSAASSVVVWNDLPGVTLAAFPYLEKKHQLGVLIVGAKGSNFKLGEDVVRVCSRLGLDGIWLSQQADELPTYTDEQIIRQARLVLSMVRDQVRLASMESEIDSLSGQLANTYEELSLIYQLSSGMKINRSSGDFFKQACLDVMEVMSMKGMGVALRADSFHAQDPVLYGALSLPPAGPSARRRADDHPRQRKSPLLINHLVKDKTLSWMAEYATQILAVPLMRQEQVLDVCSASTKPAASSTRWTASC